VQQPRRLSPFGPAAIWLPTSGNDHH